jgi:arabinan endo-1,5-alpha-L-arabinosidase
MRLANRLAAPFVLCMAVGCGATSEEPSDIGVAQSALEAAPAAAVLAFDDASLWQGPGIVGTSSAHTQGLSSLAVRPQGYSVYESKPFAFAGRAKKVLVDLQLPATQPNPYWLGAVQLYFEAPSRNLYNAYVGQVELTGRALGVFNTLEFSVSESIRNALAEGASDLKVKVVLNVPGAPGVYLLDNLRIRTDLIAHYEFDAPAADASVLDTSGWDRTATLRGGAALTSDGQIASALSLNGAGAYLELPNAITEGVKELTVATWVNVAGFGAWSRIFDFGGSAGFMYLTPSTHDGFLRFSTFAGEGAEGTVTAPALPLAAWKHVAVTSTGRDYRVYVDGVEVANALTMPTTPADIGVNTGNWIGRSRFPDPFFNGRLDDFRIYDRVLKQSEIAALAVGQHDYSSYRFDEVAGSAVKDSSQLQRDGVLFGSATHPAGLIGNSLLLPGTGAHVQLPPGVVQSCTDLTVTAWVKLRNNLPWNRVFDFGKPDFSSFMYLSPAGFGPSGQELRFGLISPRGIHDVGFPYVLPLNEWTHLAVVLRDDTATLFLNGRAVTRQGGVISNPSDMGLTTGNYFGRSTFADPPLDGALDDFRISCRAFADGEIEQLAHLPAPAVLPNQLPLTGDTTNVHDPSIIAAQGRFHVFSTGPGLLERRSTDLKNWKLEGSVFAQNPAWVTDRFGALDALWAPDISFFGGTYHLYYAASTFGSNHSCIGHATKANLASATPWADQGPVLCSNEGGSSDDFNAIDPNVVVDAAGTPWLSFGSFWSGLKMVRLTSSGARADDVLTSIASRGGGPIEAPFIIYRAPYYYQFASFDFCCQGANSNYRVVVGRSTSVTGPYLDRTGAPMLNGGGTPVVSGDSRWRGPGHNAILSRNGQLLNVYHSYDALNAGMPTLRISELVWQEGWPISAEP